jgi:diadenosine tetraphosphate (Ap4A) HIT family hydrolase
VPPRTESDEKYILDLVAQVLAEPDYRWQHRFPTLLGDAGRDGRQRPLPVDGYFPRHQLIVEYWEKQHSAPVPIMDEGPTVSGMSRGHQRRLYDLRRQQWAAANRLRFVVLDYRGFQTDERGRLQRSPTRDRQIVADALWAAGVLSEPARRSLAEAAGLEEASGGCFLCRLAGSDPALPAGDSAWPIVWQNREILAVPDPRPPVYGCVLVAPRSHRRQVSGDFTLQEYLAMQRVIYALAEAVRLALQPEQIHILSLGSQQADDHLRWRIVPCPPGGSPDRQPLALLDAQAQGVLALSQEEGQALATCLRSGLPAWMQNK